MFYQGNVDNKVKHYFFHLALMQLNSNAQFAANYGVYHHTRMELNFADICSRKILFGSAERFTT